nr:transforming acidic coiled-coil-containing protein 3 isoform X1 [Anolis sagrei ordinatus]XP_060625274.1 transforming acidic coiled-coil-containing protein 3 isoform X1 [Anolis sagrei ordinatus]XP_060625276.1 transforming acidic coiled-coil-containing protein 3 isoform X1 [Anolis sagrei ordinatus]XP_060625277.1 transforming acidic coiled-coil-containing protein 3 isoform X1 [Anolis sagrei ordinatus]
MSLQALKGENISDGIGAENCAMLITSPELTGRPSILRPSQKENVPPKEIMKFMKVTFQTPIRDPQTRKIVSPDIRKKPETYPLVGDCIPEDLVLPPVSAENQPILITDIELVKEELSFDSPNDVMPQKDRTHTPESSVLNDPDPFKSTSGLLNSPKNQAVSLLQVCTRKEAKDRNSISLCEVYLKPATEDNLSEETSHEPASSFDFTSLLDSDSSKQILSLNQSIKQDSNSACKTEVFSMAPIENNISQPVLESGSFGSFSYCKRKEKAKGQTSTGTEDNSVPKAAYNFDFDKFDPNFNPFGGGSKLQNSPNCSVFTIEKNDTQEDSGLFKEDFLEAEQLNFPEESKAVETTFEKQEEIAELVATEKQDITKVGTQTEPSSELMNQNIASPVVLVQQSSLLHETANDKTQKPSHQTETVMNEGSFLDIDNEEFRSPSDVLEMDLEVDYLEQFGTSSFKESVLRKQSLYLKFDPLLSESPKKFVDGAKSTGAALLQNDRHSIAMAVNEVKTSDNHEEKLLGLDLLGTPPDPAKTLQDILVEKNPSVFPCALPTEAIIEVLKYSQKDMDAAVEKVKHEMDVVVKKLTSEVEEKQREALEWKMKHDKIYIESQEMGTIVAEFEGTITQVMEERESQKELSKKELQKVVDEKQQLVSDLNSMEKSFSELFKRFEKQKEAIEGFQRNEEALKKCVEEYLARIKKEEQRYQALKAHAEEKLCKANEEIAQVRSKAKTDVLALQATLRKEQMRVQSLEKSIEQKAKENEELTKICDDLISKMENALV